MKLILYIRRMNKNKDQMPTLVALRRYNIQYSFSRLSHFLRNAPSIFRQKFEYSNIYSSVYLRFALKINKNK